MLHKNRRGIELQMHPKASKPVKHTTYYSWTVQPLQRYCFSKVLFNTWLARKWHLLSWGWCDWRQWRGVPSSHRAWALIGHPVPVISFLLSKHQLYPCTLWVSAACHSNPEWHNPGYPLCPPCVLMDTASLCLLLLPDFPAVVSSVRPTKGLTAITKLT